MPKYVVSTTIKDPEWQNSHVISENVPEEIEKLKETSTTATSRSRGARPW